MQGKVSTPVTDMIDKPDSPTALPHDRAPKAVLTVHIYCIFSALRRIVPYPTDNVRKPATVTGL